MNQSVGNVSDSILSQVNTCDNNQNSTVKIGTMQTNMSKKSIWILFGVSILLSIISICISLVRSEPLTLDGMSVLVGILSLLVTLLLGWQIYTFIDIKCRIKNMIKEEIDGKAKYVYNGIIGNAITYQVEDVKFYTIEKDWNRVLSLYNNILRGYIKLEDKGNIEEMVDNIQMLFKLHSKDISPIYNDVTIQTLKVAIHYTDKAYYLLLSLNDNKR